MEVNEKYIQKYWYEIVRDQVSGELEEKGFNVLHDYSLNVISLIFMLKKERIKEL